MFGCKTVKMVASEQTADSKIVFELNVVDDWPPVSAETLWAHHLGDDRYRIANVPFFVRDLAADDVVLARAPDPTSRPVFIELLERSDRCTIRLIVYRAGPLGGDVARALEPFTELGVYGEGYPQLGMLALDVEPTAPLAEIVALLRRGVDDGSWDYEEGRITPTWIAATA